MFKKSDRNWDCGLTDGRFTNRGSPAMDGNSRWHHEMQPSGIDVLALSGWSSDGHGDACADPALGQLWALSEEVCFASSVPAATDEGGTTESARGPVAETASGDFTGGGAVTASLLPRFSHSSGERHASVHGSGHGGFGNGGGDFRISYGFSGLAVAG